MFDLAVLERDWDKVAYVLRPEVLAAQHAAFNRFSCLAVDGDNPVVGRELLSAAWQRSLL